MYWNFVFIYGMKNKSKKLVNRNIVKPCFPDLELAFLGFSLFSIGIVIMQIAQGKKDFLYLLPLIFILPIFGYIFTNYRVKKVEKIGTDLMVKPLLRKSKRYNVRNIQGYQLYETYDRSGLIKQIRLLDLHGHRIVFARDAYAYDDYERLIQLIKNCGFQSLGDKEIKWKFKHTYGIISTISFLIAMMLYFLLKVLKN